MLIFSLKDRLLSVLLNQNAPCIILQPVFPEKRDLSTFSSRVGTLPVAVSEGSTGCRNQVPPSVVVSGGAAILATDATVSEAARLWFGPGVGVSQAARESTTTTGTYLIKVTGIIMA